MSTTNQNQPHSTPQIESVLSSVKELLRVDSIGTRVSKKFNDAMTSLHEAFASLASSPSDGMAFEFRDPRTGETRSVSMSRAEIQAALADELQVKLTMSAGVHADDFELVDAPTPKPNKRWPAARDVGRFGDMGKGAHLRVGLDAENDVYVSVYDENGGAAVEFCVPYSGGGQSRQTREALIGVMIAMEADNAECPSRDFWAARG